MKKTILCVLFLLLLPGVALSATDGVTTRARYEMPGIGWVAFLWHENSLREEHFYVAYHVDIRGRKGYDLTILLREINLKWHEFQRDFTPRKKEEEVAFYVTFSEHCTKLCEIFIGDGDSVPHEVLSQDIFQHAAYLFLEKIMGHKAPYQI